MCFVSQDSALSLAILLLLILSTPSSCAFGKNGNNIRSAVFRSPKFELSPGSVVHKFYYDIEFPRGHIAIKSLTAEVVDEADNPITLHETYIHHWVFIKYHQSKNVTHKEYPNHWIFPHSDYVLKRNSGMCQKDVVAQYFGLGSETRGTITDIPDPFGIEIGNPEEIPEGYEEKWMLNVHFIDTRGVEDKMGCIECRCDLYNVTKNEKGLPLMPSYKGGFLCCYDNTHCRVREGFKSAKRSLYLKYTIKWVDWDSFVVPVEVYILDVTDTVQILKDTEGASPNHNCKVEYEVEACSRAQKKGYGCLDVQRTSIPMQTGGYLIYAVAHQHAGAVGATLYGQDGRVLCSSKPRYGKGKEAGNEAGYIVGMSTCYPQPGSVEIIDAETLILESNYTATRSLTGVMTNFYLLLAKHLPVLPRQHPNYELIIV